MPAAKAVWAQLLNQSFYAQCGMLNALPPTWEETCRDLEWLSGLRGPSSSHPLRRKPYTIACPVALGTGAGIYLLPTGAIRRYGVLQSGYRLGSRSHHAKPTGVSSGRQRGQLSPR